MEKRDKKNITVVIPAYRPDEKLTETVEELIKTGFSDIVVVDDGSTEKYLSVFAALETIPECSVLRHPVNRGKGAALKTAMKFFLEHRPDGCCVVTADADGQHLSADIEAVALAAARRKSVVLGVRNFSGDQVPAKSRMGNRITCGVFRLFFGMKISDTQTGLRAFPRRYLPKILAVSGNRYEYETNMLFLINRHGIPLEEVPIATVYLEENKSSHFRVVKDSIRIYALIIKYILSSAAATVIDKLVFYLLKHALFLEILPIPLIFTASFLARIMSSLVNYWMNASIVFQEKTSVRALGRYYLLAAVQLIVSAVLVFTAEQLLRISSAGMSTLMKTAIDTVLFFFSFRIQHKWVFCHKEREAD